MQNATLLHPVRPTSPYDRASSAKGLGTQTDSGALRTAERWTACEQSTCRPRVAAGHLRSQVAGVEGHEGADHRSQVAAGEGREAYREARRREARRDHRDHREDHRDDHPTLAKGPDRVRCSTRSAPLRDGRRCDVRGTHTEGARGRRPSAATRGGVREYNEPVSDCQF